MGMKITAPASTVTSSMSSTGCPKAAMEHGIQASLAMFVTLQASNSRTCFSDAPHATMTSA